jgi:DNA-binding transcriptional regulator YhcF (GntR family)
MRLWLSKNSAASLRDQLGTQLTLGVISGDLKPGEKLPSVRELARRHEIHSNTVSAAYRDVEARGWLEVRKGSGVYVRDLRQPTTEKSSLVELIEGFLEETRRRGFSAAEVRTGLARVLGAAPIRQITLIEPEPELCGILTAELREHIALPVTAAVPEGSAAVALMSRAHLMPPGMPSRPDPRPMRSSVWRRLHPRFCAGFARSWRRLVWTRRHWRSATHARRAGGAA